MESPKEATVLVVDDDERVRAFLVTVLRARGFEVIEAATGLQALRSVLLQPDLIVLDANLPELDGFEVCRRIKADPATTQIPVLMLSGVYRDTEDKTRALEDGSDAYLTKPITPRELTATVRAMLRMRRAERETEERQRAADALQQRVAQAKSMVEVARAITASLDLQAVLERIVDQACLLLEARRVALAVLDREGTESVIRFVAARGLSKDFTDLRPLHRSDGTTPMAIAERRPVWSADLLNDPAFALTPATRRVVEAEGYRAVLSVPLLAGERTLGAIVMYRDARGPFSEDDIDLLQVFAAQASVALENAELYRRADARAEKLKTLSTLTQLITSAAGSREVFDAIAEGATRLCDGQMARVWVDDREARVLRVEGSFSPDAERERWVGAPTTNPYDAGFIGRVFTSRIAEYVLDVQRDPRWPTEPLASAPELHGYAGVPLVTGDRVVGVLSVLFTARRDFTDEDKELMRLLADQAAIAITQAQLYAEAERRTREAEVMTELARDINASLDLDTVLQRVVQGAQDLCRADFSRIALRDPADGTMRFRHATGTRSDLWTALRVEPGKGSGGQVLVTGQPFLTDNYLEDPRITKDYTASAMAEGTVSEMVVPIRSHDEMQGLLYVTNRSPRPFTDHDEAILLRLANYAGAAIMNAALYQKLRRAHENLEHSQAHLIRTERLRALGEMAAGVAHDFNNLLAVILGRTELLMRRTTDPDLVLGLQFVRRAAQDGADTVRRIQEFTRTRRSRPFERVELGDVVREVVELTRPRWKDEAQSHGVRYDVIVEGNAPPIAGRPEELREVFTNLLTNALEAMPSGGTCRFALAGDATWVTVAVSDAGVGMSDEAQARVFEPFFTSKGPRGTGLGLSVSWGIVTRHGGRIELQSRPGVGSTFLVRLPVPREMPPPRRDIRPPAPWRAARILVIDDEPAVRSVVADLLKEAGYSVVEASGGIEGLERCEHETLDLVLTDLSMPGMSGWDVASACRARFPDIPLGLVTGWGDQLDQERVAGSGISFVIAKPFRAEEVLREIAQALAPS